MRLTLSKSWLIWLATASFVLFQFFLQLSSGVLISSLMHDFSLDALAAALLSSSYYYIYTGLQIPVGVIFDRLQARSILSISCALCGLGCLLFAHATNLNQAIIGRLAMGGGAAFAFVGMLAIIRWQFSAKRYAFMVGLSETMGLIGSMIGSIALAALILTIGWRQSLYGGGILALIIAVVLWWVIPLEDKSSAKQQRIPVFQALWHIIKLPLAWLNGFYIGVLFAIVTVYAALWGTPFLETKLGISLPLATSLNSLVFFGAAFGCPLFGIAANQWFKRKRLLRVSSFGSAVLLSLVIYLPSSNLTLHALLLFSLGFICSSYMLSFSISDELSPPNMRNTFAGFTNSLSVITAPLLQPLIGHFLVFEPGAHHHFELIKFQEGLLVLPILLVIAGLIVSLLPDTPG